MLDRGRIQLDSTFFNLTYACALADLVKPINDSSRKSKGLKYANHDSMADPVEGFRDIHLNQIDLPSIHN